MVDLVPIQFFVSVHNIVDRLFYSFNRRVYFLKSKLEGMDNCAKDIDLEFSLPNAWRMSLLDYIP